jgi:hypothetical protein
MSISYYLCWFALPIFLTCCASAYLTGLLCRFAQRRHWSVRLYFGFIGALAAGTLAVLFIWLGLSIPHGEIGKIDEGAFYRFMFLRVSACALVPAFVVAWYYRRRFRHVDVA